MSKSVIVITERILTALALRLLASDRSPSEVQRILAEASNGAADEATLQLLQGLDSGDVVDDTVWEALADSVGDAVQGLIQGIRVDPAKRALRRAKRQARRENRK